MDAKPDTFDLGADLDAVLAFTQETAAEASTLALSMRGRGGMNVRSKADGTLVTDIDRAVEERIRARITQRFPAHAILGEEFGTGDRAGVHVPLWAIDPIDGTTNLSCGLPHWGTSIGLIAGGVPVVGVASFPDLSIVYAGARGLGATRNGTPLAPLPAGGPLSQEDPYGICTTSVHVVSFDRFPGRLRLYGSAALDYCWAADGSMAGAQSVGVALYDVAAALCFAGEVGAETRWLRSGALFSPEALATAGRVLHDVLITAPPATITYLRSVLALR
jgi:myo-inositol-1(or 4)-monophosphatase